MSTRFPRRLIIHFDINKTIIMSDLDKEGDSMLNSMLSECIWGEMEASTPRENRTGKEWRVKSSEPTMISPDPGNPNVLTYGEYLENQTNLSKKERKVLKTTFSEPGHIGESCRSLHCRYIYF